MKFILTLLTALLLTTPLAAMHAYAGIERSVSPLRESIPGLRIKARAYPKHAANDEATARVKSNRRLFSKGGTPE
jgi:hypothetical protein